MTVQSALRKNSLDITEENLLKLKYDQESVSDYIEVCCQFSYCVIALIARIEAQVVHINPVFAGSY